MTCFIKNYLRTTAISLIIATFLLIQDSNTQGWTQWSQYSACSSSCGNGIKKRTRTCVKPNSFVIGRECYGKAEETLSCSNFVSCAIDGNWCSWSYMPIKASATCGKNHLCIYERLCACPEPNQLGMPCKPDVDIVKSNRFLHDTNRLPVNADEQMGLQKSSLKYHKCSLDSCSQYKPTSNDIFDRIAHGYLLLQNVTRQIGKEPLILNCEEFAKASHEYLKDYFPNSKHFWNVVPSPSPAITSHYPMRKITNSPNIQMIGPKLIINKPNQNTDAGIYRYGLLLEAHTDAIKPIDEAVTLCFFVVEKRKKIIHELLDPLQLECDVRNIWPVIKTQSSGRWFLNWKFIPKDGTSEQELLRLEFSNTFSSKTDVGLTLDKDPETPISREKSGNNNPIATPWDVWFTLIPSFKEKDLGDYVCTLENHDAYNLRNAGIYTVVKISVELNAKNKYLKWLFLNKALVGTFCLAIFITVSCIFAIFIVLLLYRNEEAFKKIKQENSDSDDSADLASRLYKQTNAY